MTDLKEVILHTKNGDEVFKIKKEGANEFFLKDDVKVVMYPDRKFDVFAVKGDKSVLIKKGVIKDE